MGAAREIGEGLVNGDSLDQRREIVQHIDGGIAQALIILEMTAHKNQLWTKLARPPS
jgi:hypothetical protein